MELSIKVTVHAARRAMFGHKITHFKEQIGRKEKSVYKNLMACDARSDVPEKNLDIVGRCIN